MTTDTVFAKLPDDLVLNIFFKLEEDPRNWARMACVCTKFLSLVTDVCWKTKCSQTIPAVVADLVAVAGADPPGGWSALHKLAVCCPGLLHSGVLLENSDFGLERELGPDEKYQDRSSSQMGQIKNQNQSLAIPSSSGNNQDKSFSQMGQSKNQAIPSSSGNNEATQECSWSLYDDLYYDTVYVTPELPEHQEPEKSEKGIVMNSAESFSVCKKRKVCRPLRSHLASRVWNLCREQGNKLLASRFRGDCLYICDWPGCIHMEEKRNYMLFRGVFKDFKKSRVWRTINDGNRSKIDLNCAFCACKQTWDLHSAFCLRRVYGFHDDGEPVVRAYVCENGHVSGAWTDWPLYT